MKNYTLILFTALFFISIATFAQSAALVTQMEEAHKECMRIKPDSNACSKLFLSQMDSMVTVVFIEVKAITPAEKVSSLLQEQMSWSKKKGEFFKIQDDTFKYNLQEGTWTKDMIRISYQQKADFILKRIKVLLKRL